MATHTLVLVPGLGSDAAVWRRTIAALGNDYRCLVGDTLNDDTLQGMARRIRSGAAELRSGRSLDGRDGGTGDNQSRPRTGDAACVGRYERATRHVRAKFYRRLANVVVGATNDFEQLSRRNLSSLVHPSTAKDVRDELVQMSTRVGAKTYIRQNRAVTARGDLRKVLPDVAIPTAVIVGQEDQITPVTLSEEIHALTPGSMLHVIPDCGHLPPIEKPDIIPKVMTTDRRERSRAFRWM